MRWSPRAATCTTVEYRLSIDFVSDPEAERLLPFIKRVKIDTRSLSAGAQGAPGQAFRGQ